MVEVGERGGVDPLVGGVGKVEDAVVHRKAAWLAQVLHCLGPRAASQGVAAYLSSQRVYMHFLHCDSSASPGTQNIKNGKHSMDGGNDIGYWHMHIWWAYHCTTS